MIAIGNNMLGNSGTSIFYQVWIPKDEPKAIVLILHGIGEHGGIWGHLVQALTAQNIVVFAPDHRGCGRSEGKRNHMADLDDHFEDEIRLHAIIREKYPDIPLFIYGHSFGGLLAFNFVNQRPELVAGIIASGFGIIEPYPILIRFFGLLLGKIFPRLSVPLRLKPEIMTSDKAEQELYASDPYVNQKSVTLGFGRALLRGVPPLMRDCASISHPVLFQWGKCDPTLAHPERTQFHFKNAEVRLILYPECRHNPYIEIPDIIRQACDDIIRWIELHNMREAGTR